MLDRLRAAARLTPLYPPYVRWKYRRDPQARAAYFTGVYRRNIWADPESRSGHGSTLVATEHLRAELPAFLSSLGVRSLLDMPCGDWAWMQSVDLGGLDRYVGGDIVPELIERLAAEHGAPGREFEVLDAISSPLPRCDAVLLRDILGHLDDRQVRAAVQNVEASGATWLLVTTYPSLTRNTDIPMGGWRPQNFTLPPYSWPAPTAILMEQPRAPRIRRDKAIGAWRVPSRP